MASYLYNPWDEHCVKCGDYVFPEDRVPKRRICRNCKLAEHRAYYQKTAGRAVSFTKADNWDGTCVYCGTVIPEGDTLPPHLKGRGRHAHYACFAARARLKDKGVTIRRARQRNNRPRLCAGADGNLAVQNTDHCRSCLKKRIEELRQSKEMELYGYTRSDRVPVAGLV